MKQTPDTETEDLRGGLTHRITLDPYNVADRGKDVGQRKRKADINRELYGEGLLGDDLAPKKSGELSRRFMVPPFTVLSAREGWWQDRKRAWLDLGIQSELGRGDDGRAASNLPNAADGTLLIDQYRGKVAQNSTLAKETAPPPPRARFSAPTIIVEDETESQDQLASQPLPVPELMRHAMALPTEEPPPFDASTWDDTKPAAVGMDIESYNNYFFVGFKNFATSKRLGFEMSGRSTLDVDAIRRVLATHCIITFNGLTYDLPVLAMALRGDSARDLKLVSNEIINQGVKHWEVEKKYGIQLPRCNHVDLSEPNPSVRQSLKTLGARLHAPLVMDLPYDPEATLTRQQMNVVSMYCHNDLDHTHLLFNALREPLSLRVSLGKRYGLDLRSRSDAQVGEDVVRKRIEKATGRRLSRKAPETDPTFRYMVPPFISFRTPQLREMADRLAVSEFHVHGYGVDAPAWLKESVITLGGGTYQMGIGGLHSTEETRAAYSDDDHQLVDADVAGQYPAIIVKLGELGLHPKGAGKAFTAEFKQMLIERNEAKRAVKTATGQEKEALKAATDGGKIANNGVYGKLLSSYSFLYQPSLGIGTTLTGQLTVLMLVERAELAGIPVISANTDGALFRCPRGKLEELNAMLRTWEAETGFEVETAKYRSIHNSSVNTYIAVKEDGTVKRKGPPGNPWAEGDLRGQLSKNPQMTVCSDAVVELIKTNRPLEESIRACTNPRAFITVIQARDGAKWREQYLGRVVRYYWSTDHAPIYSAGGKKRKIAKTDGARPMMELATTLPDDIDWPRYIREATDLARDLGVIKREGMI